MRFPACCNNFPFNQLKTAVALSHQCLPRLQSEFFLISYLTNFAWIYCVNHCCLHLITCLWYHICVSNSFTSQCHPIPISYRFADICLAGFLTHKFDQGKLFIQNDNSIFKVQDNSFIPLKQKEDSVVASEAGKWAAWCNLSSWRPPVKKRLMLW